jgi:tetratricopeptide (TPR) repeat protein
LIPTRRIVYPYNEEKFMIRLFMASAVSFALFQAGCGRSGGYYVAKGNKLFAQGKYDEAALNYHKAISKQSNAGEPYFRLGLAELKMGHSVAAFQDLSAAVRLLPDRDDVKVELADLSLSTYLSSSLRPKLLYDTVNRVVEQLLANNPKSYDGLRLEGFMAASAREFHRAESLFRAANAIKPMQPPLIMGWVETLFQDGQANEAESLARQLIEREKTYAPIYELLYRHYLQANDLSKAEKILQARIVNNPRDAASPLELAALYNRLSRGAEMKAVLQRVLDDPLTFRQAHLFVGDFYARLQRWNDAIAQYVAGVEDNPGKEKLNERAVYLKKIADGLLVQGRGQQAFDVVEEILKENPGDHTAQGVKASMLRATGGSENVTRAASLFQQLSVQDPQNSLWHYNLGLALLAKGEADGARIQFQKAAEQRPDYVEPRIALIELSQSRGDYRRMLAYANEILAVNPKLSAMRLVRAVSLLNTGNETQGRQELARLQKDYPTNREVVLQLAILDLHDNKFKEAEEQFRKLSREAPGDLRSTTGLVRSLAAENQLDQAVSLLQEAVRKSPRNDQLHFLLAVVAGQAGKYDLASGQYQQLLAANPKSAQLNLSLGSIYRAKRNFATAISYFQKASALAPNEAAPWLALGEAQELSGRKADALASFRRALQLRPDDPAALNGMAYLLAETGGSLDEAIKFAQKAVRFSSQQPNFSDTLGWIYCKKKLYDSALRVFGILTEKYPDNPTFHYHFAMTLLASGDKPRAKAELKAALSSRPSDEVRHGVEEALAQIG